MAVALKKLAKKLKEYEHVLVIMRHAKAQLSSPQDDWNRELTDKGRKQAKTVARGLEKLSLIPERISCSAATRSKQTLDRMLKVFGDKPKIEYQARLYEEGIQAILDQLSGFKHSARVAMIIGHEPSASMACQWLADVDCNNNMRNLLSLGLTPASIVIFGSHLPFAQWQVRTANLIAVITPKDF